MDFFDSTKFEIFSLIKNENDKEDLLHLLTYLSLKGFNYYFEQYKNFNKDKIFILKIKKSSDVVSVITFQIFAGNVYDISKELFKFNSNYKLEVMKISYNRFIDLLEEI